MSLIVITSVGGQQYVYIDGVAVEDVVSVGFNAGADEQNEVTIVLAPKVVIVNTDAAEITKVEQVQP